MRARRALPAIVASLVVGLMIAGPFPQISTATAAAATWSFSVVPSPNLGSGHNRLAAVAAVSATDVWAVGHAGNQVLIERWNGTAWSVFPAPDFAATKAHLYGVTAVSTSNVWAVGSADSRTLALHFDGTTWTRVKTPNVGTKTNSLRAVSATSGKNVWAVGRAGTGLLAERYDGTAWHVVSTPSNVSEPAALNGVEAGGTQGVLAVGTKAGRWHGTAFSMRRVEHGWRVVSVPLPASPWPMSASSSSLDAVGRHAGGPVLAVGGFSPDPGSAGFSPIVERWGSGAWHLQSRVPGQGGFTSSLHGVVVPGDRNAWAVGDGSLGTLVLHWTGTWTIVPSPNAVPSPQEGIDQLLGVDTVSGAVWAVGFSRAQGGEEQTLILLGTKAS